MDGTGFALVLALVVDVRVAETEVDPVVPVAVSVAAAAAASARAFSAWRAAFNVAPFTETRRVGMGVDVGTCFVRNVNSDCVGTASSAACAAFEAGPRGDDVVDDESCTFSFIDEGLGS